MNTDVPLCSMSSHYRIVIETRTRIQLGSMQTKDVERCASNDPGLITQGFR